MGRSGRWLLVVVGVLVVFGLCVVLGDLLLPWDRGTRVGTGAGAGAVVAGVLVAWASSLIGSPAASGAPTASGASAAGSATAAGGMTVTASGERAVAVGDNSGVIITGDHGSVQR
jgi:hypothetical protein